MGLSLVLPRLLPGLCLDHQNYPVVLCRLCTHPSEIHFVTTQSVYTQYIVYAEYLIAQSPPRFIAPQMTKFEEGNDGQTTKQ